MVKNISITVAQIMGRQLKSDPKQVEVYAYGLELILGGLLKLTLLLILGYILGILNLLLLVLIPFVLIRHYAGGVHFSTYERCLVTGVILFVALGLLSQLSIEYTSLIFFFGLTIGIGVYSLIKWIPAGTSKKTISDIEIRFEQKKKTLIVLTLWLVTIIVLILNKHAKEAFALILGAFSSLTLTIPITYSFVSYLEKSIGKIIK